MKIRYSKTNNKIFNFLYKIAFYLIKQTNDFIKQSLKF